MPSGLTGGCACGAVRYRLDAVPFDAGYCHCTICRKSSGAPVLAFASVPRALYIVTAGEPRRRQSSGIAAQATCDSEFFFSGGNLMRKRV